MGADLSNKKSKVQLQIESLKGRLSDKEKEKMKQNALEFKEQDENYDKYIEARQTYEKFQFKISKLNKNGALETIQEEAQEFLKDKNMKTPAEYLKK